MATSLCKSPDVVLDHYSISTLQEADRQDNGSRRASCHQTVGQFSRTAVLLGIYALRSVWLYQLWHSIHHHELSDITVARIYLSCQVLMFVADIIQTAWRLLCNSDTYRPRLRLVGSHVPLVDVVITTCGEDHDIILDTVHACCAANYPRSRRRVLVSDDSADDELRQKVQGLEGNDNVSLHYFTRNSKGVRKPGAKAGNMNAALAHLDAQNGGVPYPYVVFIDADMIVEPDFLRAQLAHLLTYSSAGLCIIPQNFYNIPVGDPLTQSLHAQQQWDEVVRDTALAAWNSGSSALMRRTALADIGGVPESGLTEDVLTGVLMQGRGWQVLYCNEPLQWGLAPETFLAHIKQRIRWSVGAFRDARHHAFGTSISLLPRMTFAQRYLAFTDGARCWFSIPVDVLCRWIFLILVATGQPLIVGEDIRPVLRTYSVLEVLRTADEVLSSTHAGYIVMRMRDLGHAWLSPYLAIAFLKELLPSTLGGTQVQFVPTGISESVLAERKPGMRASLAKRLYSMISQHGLWYHVATLTIAVAVCSAAIQQCTTRSWDNDGHGRWQLVLRHVLVPGLEWNFYLAGLQPVLYAVWPPSMPSRREQLQRTVIPIHPEQTLHVKTDDVQTHVWRPRPEFRELHWSISSWLTILPHVAGQLFWVTVGIKSIY
ncbi:hypothetical protein AMS68_002620 [Peltaster fructicola]|uniref:Glycosyltransferase 2-like domain-containing protein n=1 Tax=Peltaster fructicola TaxID=286661 RepID=A0A6H0XQW9_9PEZI|nr:hypothetical protein AMS68_002620 [Peltaster fructicola]